MIHSLPAAQSLSMLDIDRDLAAELGKMSVNTTELGQLVLANNVRLVSHGSEEVPI